jgi:hypothetical protein
VNVIKWDAKTSQGWSHWVDGSHAIVNLAGARLAGYNPLRYRWTTNRKRIICDSRLFAGKAVVEAVEQSTEKPAVVFQASGVDYYYPGDEIVTEASPPGEDFLSTICTECWEASTIPVRSLGVRHVIARIGPILQNTSGPLPPLTLLSRLFFGGPLGTGRQWFSWVHPTDVVRGIRFLIDNSETEGAYNLCAPHPLTNADFNRVLAKVLHRPSWFPTPGFLLRFLYGELSVTLLQGVRASPQRLLDAGFNFQFPTAELALTDLLA